MIYVDSPRCRACGECLALCPQDAISMRAGSAFIDETQCTGCEACVKACPEGAILVVDAVQPEEESLVRQVAPRPVPLANQPSPDLPTLRHQEIQIPTRSLVLPAIGAALLWTGRELVPRLASLALHLADRQASLPTGSSSNRSPAKPSGDRSGRGRRLRQRRRGRG